MNLRSELSDIKNQIVRGNTDEIEEEIEYKSVSVQVYTQGSYLVVEIPETHGNPHSPEIRNVQKRAIEVFGMDMLPDPGSGSVKGSIKLDEIN